MITLPVYRDQSERGRALRAAHRSVEHALLSHQREIDWGYEWTNCSCGWRDPEALGVRTIRDGTRSWDAHQRKAVLAAMEAIR